MTARTAAGKGTTVPFSTMSHEQAAVIVAQIECGLTDPFLRALYEAVVERRRVLTEDGTLPEQQRIQPAEVKYEIDHDMKGDYLRPTAQATPQPAVIDPPVAPARRRRGVKSVGPKVAGLGHVSARPSATNTNLVAVLPLTRMQWVAADQNAIFIHGGLRYMKAEFRGHQVQGQLSSGDMVTFQINGVGDRSIKCQIVTEPPRGVMSGKTNLWEKWNANEPVFMPHSLIAPWLIVPTDLTPYM